MHPDHTVEHQLQLRRMKTKIAINFFASCKSKSLEMLESMDIGSVGTLHSGRKRKKNVD